MDTYSLPFVSDPHGCSREGAQHALPTAGSQLERVWQEIQAHGPLSDRQLAERTGYAISVICARRNELVKRGLVGAVGAAMGSLGVRNNLWAATKGGVSAG